MTGSKSAVGDVDVDLGRLFGSLLRNWLRILAATLAVTAAVFLLTTMAEPHFRAETRILIENRQSVYARPTNTTTESGEGPLLDEAAIASQVELIGSTDILREVARKLNLAERDGFVRAGEPSALDGFLIRAGLKRDPAQASTEERVLQKLRSDLSVYRVDSSRVIVIGFSSTEPELAAAIPNAVADAYIAVQEEAKRVSTNDAAGWLEPEIAEMRERVREAEARVADYRAANDLFLGQGATGLTTQQLGELQSELTRVRAARSAAQARAQAIRTAMSSRQNVDSIPEVLASPLVQRIRERQVQIESDLATLSATLLGNHPRIRALRSQLGESDAQMRAEVAKVLRGIESEAENMRSREAELVAELSGTKAAVASAGEAEVELRALEREAAAERALLESYLTRYREAAARADSSYMPADARIFSRATVPFEPYYPKVLPITAAAFVASLLVMALITLLAELFSGRAMRPASTGDFGPVEDVAMPAPAPTRAALLAPSASPAKAEEPVPAAQPDQRETDVELSISDAANHLVASGAMRAVFVSPEGDEAAAASVMVAREIADSGLRVIFLDLTSSGAPSASMLDSNRYPGITNLLASRAQFSEVIRGDLYSDCHVIPLGTADAERALRAIDRMPIILDSLSSAYDMVVVECGAADAREIERVVGSGTEVLVGVIEPGQAVVSTATEDLASSGYKAIRVTPVGHDVSPAPEGRSVA